MAKAGVTNQLVAIMEICNLIDLYDSDIDSLSVEFLDPTKTKEELLKEAISYAKIDFGRIAIKIPFIDLSSLELVHDLHHEGIAVNMTCIMSAYQGILAYSCRPEYISFFYNRMKDYGDTKLGNMGHSYAHDQIRILDDYIGKRIRTNIICGSIRYPNDVPKCFDAGTDIVTVPYDILQQMFKHDKTTEAIAEFATKWKEQRK